MRTPVTEVPRDSQELYFKKSLSGRVRVSERAVLDRILREGGYDGVCALLGNSRVIGVRGPRWAIEKLRADPRTFERVQCLLGIAYAAEMARQLSSIIVADLHPRRTIVRQLAWDSSASLFDLAALKTALAGLFDVNAREFGALVRHENGGPR